MSDNTDDAPELTDEFFAQAVIREGETVVRPPRAGMASRNVQLFDTATGKLGGVLSVPYEMDEAARALEHWMRCNGVQQFLGLKLR